MNPKILEIEARLGLVVNKHTEGRCMPFTPGAGAKEVFSHEVLSTRPGFPVAKKLCSIVLFLEHAQISEHHVLVYIF